MAKKETWQMNQQASPASIEDVTFYWKPTVGEPVEFNAFYPEVLASLNVNTPSPYEFLANSMHESTRAEDDIHTTKLRQQGWEWAGNVLEVEEAEVVADLGTVRANTRG